jgi:hypothetical protein
VKALNDDTILVAEGGSEAKMWTKVDGEDTSKWVIAGTLEY